MIWFALVVMYLLAGIAYPVVSVFLWLDTSVMVRPMASLRTLALFQERLPWAVGTPRWFGLVLFALWPYTVTIWLLCARQAIQEEP